MGTGVTNVCGCGRTKCSAPSRQTCSKCVGIRHDNRTYSVVLSVGEAEAKGDAIQVLARNALLILHRNYEDKGYLCDECAKGHECGEEMLLPIVNLPQTGVCGYAGQKSAHNW